MTLDLFAPEPSFPDGFEYRPEFLSTAEERELLDRFAELPFKPFHFQSYIANRRVLSFGWQYDFVTRELREAADMPGFLLPLRERAAALAQRAPSELQHVLLTEYAAGAGIGWHKDKAEFGEVVGVSLLSACTFRLRRKRGAGWERVSLVAEPRSAYLLRGGSRTEWEHSIPAVETLRYSITFRTLGPGET
jgi:alkylated DNA repair dioxygenase AlkB